MSGFDNLQIRRGTDAEWTSEDPVLLAGEPAFSTDTGELRIGNGSDIWSDLVPIGISDHGALSGLGDDDHPQYLTAAEGDAAYDAINAASSAVSTHAGLADPHPTYLTGAEHTSGLSGHHGQNHGNSDHTTAYTDDTTVNDHIADTGDAHDASAVSVLDSANYLAATDVEAALAELYALRRDRYGNGADGAVTLDGTNRYDWVTKNSATQYTMLRDVHATTFVLSAGITLRPLGCAVFATTSILVDGTIEWNGNPGSSNTAGTQEAGITRCAQTTAGGAGKVNTAAAGTDAPSSVTNSSIGTSGHGGAGGCSTAGIGGGGGDFSSPTSGGGGMMQLERDLPAFFYGNSSVITGMTPGTGGGGGAGAASGTSGGGGASGGAVFLLSRKVTVSATGIITVNGGNGGAASGTGPCGGGGGGGGGIVYINSENYTNSGIVRANGGTGGTGSGNPVVTALNNATFNGAAGDDTDSTDYRFATGVGNASILLVAVMSTKSGGGDQPISMAHDSSMTTPHFALIDGGISNFTLIDTQVNGDQRLTLYWGRQISNASGLRVKFASAQTSCAVQAATVPRGVLTASSTPIFQSAKNSATGANTCVVTLGATPSAQSYTFGFFAVQANVAMTAGTGFTATSGQSSNSTPAGRTAGVYGKGTVDATVDMTTAGNQNWVGIACEIRANGNGDVGCAGRVITP